MNERISFITRQEQKIMVIDFRECGAKEMLALLGEVQQAVARHPRNSLVTLGDFTHAEVDRSVATRMKEVLVMDRPYVKRSAWVGTETFPKVYLENFKSFTQRHFAFFNSREEAMEWLVKEETESQSQ